MHCKATAAFLLLAIIAPLHQCHGESLFQKLASDIKHAAVKLTNDIKRGAEDVVHHVGKDFTDDVRHVAGIVGEEVRSAALGSDDILRKFGIDVDKFVTVVRHDVSHAWVKVKPYAKEAFVYIDGVLKALEQVEETSELMDILKGSKEKDKKK